MSVTFNPIGTTKYPYTANQVGYKVNVDFVDKGIPAPIHLTQFDDTLPFLIVYLFQNGVPYEIPNSADVRIRLFKPDGQTVYNPLRQVDGHYYGGRYAQPDSSTGTIVSNAICVEITKEMTDCDGIDTAVIEITLEPAQGETNYPVLCSSQIMLYIERNPVQDNSIKSQSQYKTLDEMIRNLVVVPNPTGAASQNLYKLQIADIIYAITGGGGGGGSVKVFEGRGTTGYDTPSSWNSTIPGFTSYENGIFLLFFPWANGSLEPQTTLNIQSLGAKKIFQDFSAPGSIVLKRPSYGSWAFPYIMQYDEELDSGNGGWNIILPGILYAKDDTSYQDFRCITEAPDFSDPDTGRVPVVLSKDVYLLANRAEDKNNKVSSLSGSSTNVEYPGAKVVYDMFPTQSEIDECLALL